MFFKFAANGMQLKKVGDLTTKLSAEHETPPIANMLL